MNAEVIIVGGGIGGLSTALALSAVDVPSLVLERINFADHTGCGIQLTPNATRVLFHLGLKNPLLSSSYEPEFLETRSWKTGAVLRRVPIKKIVDQYCDSPYLQIQRSDLINILRRECDAQTNVELRAHTEVIESQQCKDRVTLSCSNGTFTAPMVIGADGTHSTMSALIGNYETPEFSGWQAWRTLLRAPSFNAKALMSTNIWCGKDGHIVHYPVNTKHNFNVVFVTKSTESFSSEWKQMGSLEQLRAYFQDWHLEVNEIIDRVDPRTLFRWGLFHHARTKHSWCSQRIVLLGDAIHPTMPFLAQGAALAIEDAIAIAKRTKECSMNVEQVIKSFIGYRKNRVQWIQSRSEKMGTIYHLGFPWSLLRDCGTSWAVRKLARDVYRFQTG